MQKVRWLDQDCNKCGRQLNSWDARLSKTLAYKYPCCESCIAGEYDMSAERLRDRMEDYFRMHFQKSTRFPCNSCCCGTGALCTAGRRGS